jgi:thiosulfate/3-mercaptopyruvate sulfurtransferase
VTSPLLDAADLAANLDDPSLRIADCRWYLLEPERGAEEYAAAHLPGAAYFSLDADLSAAVGPGRHPLPEGRATAAMLGRRGIGNEHRVVAYDDRGGAVAARLWWMLRDLGHEKVAVLDGGIPAWTAAGFPVTAVVPEWPPARFVPGPGERAKVDRHRLAHLLGDVAVVDARATERYRGEVEPVDPVAGHIPTARSLPYEDLLGADGRFLPVPDLRARIAAVVGSDARPVVYCGSGVTACHVILGLEVAGFDDAVLYPGSWSDWSTAGMPVVTGPEPGDPPPA